MREALREALTAKRSWEGWRATGPVQASPALPGEKRYARGKDRRRARRHLAVWMRRSRLGATCARTEREAPARGAARVGDPHEAWSASMDAQKAKRQKILGF